MKIKKILKILSSLLFVPVLSGCALFGGNNDNDNGKKQIVITEASFEYTYSTITFNFRKDDNAIYYNAYFRGNESKTLSRIEPKTTYAIPELPDGKYSVFLKAFANINYADSELFFAGDIQKEKSKRSNESIEVSASVTASYSIEVNVKNTKENDNAPITVKIYKDSVLFKEEKNITSKKTFSTEEELSAGEYTVSASFQETSDFLASDEKFIDQPLNIEKRKIEVKSFNATYSEGFISLYWQSQANIPSTKKLKIIQNNNETEFTDSINDTQIKSGMTFSADSFNLGEISFQLTLIPINQDTYLTSDVANAKTLISQFKEKTPNISVKYSEEGDVIVSKNDNAKGLYSVEIKAVGNPLDDSTEHSVFNYKETVSTFPLVFEKANETWRHSNYEIAVYKLASSPLGENSDSFLTEIEVDDIELLPNVTTRKNILQDGGFEITITANAPKWLNLDWTPDEYAYDVNLSGCGDLIYDYELTEQNKQITLPFYSSDMASSEYWLDVNVFFEGNVPYGYREYGSIRIDEFEFRNDRPADDHLIENLYAGDSFSTIKRGEIEVSPKITISLDKNFAYADVSGTLTYKRNTTGQNETIDFDFGEEAWKTGRLTTELRMIDFKSRYSGGFIYILVKAWLGDCYTELKWELGPLKPPVS